MKKLRMIIDMSMVVLLPVLMMYSLVGEKLHEILGLCIFFLFIAHNILNRRWWLSLFKGRYEAKQIFVTLVDVALLAYMFLQPISGILMSKHILTSLQFGSPSLLRKIHLALAYWGFVFLGMHLGLHLELMMNRMHLKKTKLMYIAMIMICLYGIYAFYARGFIGYLSLKTMFVFFDESSSRILFYLDHLAILGSLAILTRAVLNLLERKKKR